jgi:hypothetical protein
MQRAVSWVTIIVSNLKDYIFISKSVQRVIESAQIVIKEEKRGLESRRELPVAWTEKNTLCSQLPHEMLPCTGSHHLRNLLKSEGFLRASMLLRNSREYSPSNLSGQEPGWAPRGKMHACVHTHTHTHTHTHVCK